MAYARILETGAYIWSDGENLHLNDVKVPEDTINIFLARLHDNCPEELERRLQMGRYLIEVHKIEMGEYDDEI